MDSRLTEFLRRAGPILASERGWNAQSRLKLKSLAADLNLPGSLYEQALQDLQSEGPATAGLSRYESEFVRFLERHFQPRGGQVLTASQEQVAIETGMDRYGVSTNRARDLVRQAAEAAGLSRVSRLEAEARVAEWIDDLLAGQVEASDEVRQRIEAVAGPWGVGERQAGFMIDNRLAANRDQSAPPLVGPSAPWRVAVLAAGLLVALVAWFLASRNRPAEFVFAPLPVDSSDLPPRRPGQPDRLPAGWTAETADRWESLVASDLSGSLPIHLLTSPDPVRRREGVPQVLDLALGTVQPVNQLAGDFLGGLIVDDAGVASRTVADLGQRLKLPDTGSAPGGQEYESVIRAAEMLIGWLDAADPSGPPPGIRRALEDGLAIRLEPGSVREPVHRKLAETIWDHLARTSRQHPRAVARLMEPMLRSTSRLSDQASRLAWPAALQLVSRQDDAWQFMRDPLEQMIGEASEDQVFQLFEAGRQSTDPDKPGWLMPRLIRRLGLDVDDRSPAGMEQAIRIHYGLAGAGWSGVGDRWTVLTDLPAYRTLSQPDLPADPGSIADTARLATAAVLLWQAESRVEAGLLDRFDQLAAGDLRPLMNRRLMSGSVPPLPLFGQIRRPPLPSEIEVRRTSLEKIMQSAGHTPQAVANAFQRLAEVASRFPDLSPDQAERVARYMLTTDETAGLVSVEQHASRMGHWQNLVLEVCRQSTDPSSSLDQVRLLGGLLLGLEEAGLASADRGQVQRAMLEQIALITRHTAEALEQDEDWLWDELRRVLVDRYRIRCEAMDIPLARFNNTDSPGELALLMVEHLSPGDRRIESVRFLAGNDLDLAILGGQLLASVVAGQTGIASGSLPQGGSPARALLRNEQSLLQILAGQGEPQ